MGNYTILDVNLISRRIYMGSKGKGNLVLVAIIQVYGIWNFIFLDNLTIFGIFKSIAFNYKLLLTFESFQCHSL